MVNGELFENKIEEGNGVNPVGKKRGMGSDEMPGRLRADLQTSQTRFVRVKKTVEN